MENFDLKKFLIENKLTDSSRRLDESELNELDANVEKLRDAFLVKLKAISAAYQKLHNDPLFDVDRGAANALGNFFKQKEKNNDTWVALLRYVQGFTPPQLTDKPTAPTSNKPPMPNLPPKPGAPTNGKPALRTPPPINRKPTLR